MTIRLAEMGSLVGSGKDAMWMREVRKLTNSGHQTSLISTAYALPHIHLAAQMFSRWCQENFFSYMMHHFAIDLLAEYGVEDLPADKEVVNPAWRELNKIKNSLQSKLRYRQARFAEMTIHPKAEEDTKKYRNWVQKKADLFEEIQHIEHDFLAIKAKIKATPHYITWEKLEKDDSFQQLVPGRKRLLDTIKMIAYRAETAITGLLTGPTVDISRLLDVYSRICSLPRLIFSLMPKIRFYGSRSMVLFGQRPTDLSNHFLKNSTKLKLFTQGRTCKSFMSLE